MPIQARLVAGLSISAPADRLDELGAKLGRKPGPDTLEPVTLKIYEHSKTVTGAQFLTSHAAINQIRRKLGGLMSRCDVWLSPTTAAVAEPHGLYNQGLENISAPFL